MPRRHDGISAGKRWRAQIIIGLYVDNGIVALMAAEIGASRQRRAVGNLNLSRRDAYFGVTRYIGVLLLWARIYHRRRPRRPLAWLYDIMTCRAARATATRLATA